MAARAVAAVLMAGTIAFGCSRIERSYGYVPSNDQLAAIEVGRDTRETVASIIGPPGFESLRTVNGWYYVKSDYETFLYLEPDEVKREVVAILFTRQGYVGNIERFGIENGRVIALSRRVTESNITGISFLNQLVGNIGNFNVGDFLVDE